MKKYVTVMQIESSLLLWSWLEMLFLYEYR